MNQNIEIKRTEEEIMDLINTKKEEYSEIEEQLLIVFKEIKSMLENEGYDPRELKTTIIKSRTLNKELLSIQKEITKLEKELKPARKKSEQQAIIKEFKIYPELYTILEEFFINWANEYKSHIHSLKNQMNEFIKNGGSERTWLKENKKSLMGDDIFFITSVPEKNIDSRCEEFIMWKFYDLLFRIKDKAGKAESFNVYPNPAGGVDGWIKGDKATINIQTIVAGGHNIQRAHYRTLVH